MPRLMPALVAEATGVFALSFIGIMAISQLGGVANNGGLVGIALAHGLILAVAITAAGAVSGGHINPAVTVGFLVAGKIKPPVALAYIIAQLAGGFLAGAAVIGLTKTGGVAVITGGTPTINFDSVTLGGAFIAETITTFFLMMAVWGTAVDPRAPKIGGFGVGLTVTADILAIGPLTGAAMNPARAIGPALAATLFGAPATWTNPWWAHHWVYWLGPITGAVIATLLYQFFFSPEASK